MPELAPLPPASGRRVLVVEDEYLAAEDLRQELESMGLEVLGPVASVGRALILLETSLAPDAAILDINLGEETVYPLADRLQEQGIPFIFATGYDERAIPAAYAQVPRCEKPFGTGKCLRLLRDALGRP